MNNTGIIDHFLEVFTRYIDGGFGLLRGDVAFLASTLIVIDVTLAFAFSVLDGGNDETIARLIKKTMFVGSFAYLISNWNNLAAIVFNSFAGLGLKATGTGFSVTDLMRPGKLAQTGLDAAQPLIQAASGLMGFTGFFDNFVQIVCLLLAWFLVVLAFFILAIQMFIVLVEFKLTTLAGFVLIPFGLFGKSAFMAERVLGNVVSSGIKVLVLAVIVGIGSTLFSSMVEDFGGANPSIQDAMSIVLGALTLLGLGLFGPGIANGLVSGGPQLGAGAAVGAALTAGGTLAAGLSGVGMAARGVAAIGGAGMAAVRGGAAVAGGATSAYNLGAMGKQGASAVAGGLGNVARAGASAATSPLRKAASDVAASFQDGARTAFSATGGNSTAGTVPGNSSLGVSAANARTGTPAWAQRLQRQQSASQGLNTALQAVRGADAHGAGHSVSLNESE